MQRRDGKHEFGYGMARLEALGFREGSNAAPGDFVIERAFVD